jgi:hypothetical protein
MASVTTAQEIIDDAESLLQDEDNVHWTAAEHLVAVNNGSKEICIFKPDAYVVSEAVILAAGTVQSLPSGGFQLQNITHNMGTNGTTPGQAIKLVEQHTLDMMNKSWRTESSSATVDYYMYDERVPLKFHVSPPQPSSSFGYVWMSYCKAPAEILVAATILVPDIYRGALTDYVLYCAYKKDMDQDNNMQRATAYYQAFLNAIGERHNIEKVEDPNAKASLVRSR